MKFKYPVELTEEELDTICSALAVYLIAHRTDVECSPFPATVEHSRREWLKATVLRDKLDPLTDEEEANG
jgi:hypothetical protein